MVNDMFNDVAFAAAQRQAAAQALARQTTAILNADAARAEAKRRVEAGRFVTVPTAVGQSTIIRSNTIGYNAPSVSYRELTPLGNPSRAAMTPSSAFNPNIVVQNNQTSTSKVDQSRLFLSGRRL